MKRINFKPEFKDKILAGEKTATMRWKSQNWHEGEVRAAVTGQNGKPAFLTPVEKAFCRVKCKKATLTTFGKVTDEMAQRCGVTRDWYLKEYPGASEFSPIYVYEFEVVKE